MKTKPAGIFILIAVLLMGCSYPTRSESEIPEEGRFNKLQTEYVLVPSEITLISNKSPVRLGENGSLTVQGQPGIQYTITSIYRLTDKTVRTSRRKVAGADGLVTWTWKVNTNTVPGTYPLTVSGGGKKLITAYTIIR